MTSESMTYGGCPTCGGGCDDASGGCDCTRQGGYYGGYYGGEGEDTVSVDESVNEPNGDSYFGTPADAVADVEDVIGGAIFGGCNIGMIINWVKILLCVLLLLFLLNMFFPQLINGLMGNGNKRHRKKHHGHRRR
jgi:hypothetical protein